MVTKALFVRLEAKPGKEDDVASFLRSGLSVVEDEPATIAWFAVRIGPSTFGIFDAFPNEAGRQAHLSGGVAQAHQGDFVLARHGGFISANINQTDCACWPPKHGSISKLGDAG